ncbi:MAG: ABC transporter permease [Armatimonadota bacterium]
MLHLALRNLVRRPLRTALTVFGLALAIAVMAAVTAFGEGYRAGLRSELDRMGVQMMLVPLGCPYDAAARVLKGQRLEYSLPEAALAAVRRDPAVAVAAPMLLAAVPRPEEGRTDMWAGIDAEALKLRPWWRPEAGGGTFSGADSVILGAEAASVEMRAPGDRLHSPETGRTFEVTGVLQRSGTSDDSLFFIPLKSAQEMFRQEGRLTAVAIRLRDPALAAEATERLQQVSGAQVVTLTEMMGAFLNLVGAVRTLVAAIALVAVAASTLGVFNTMLASVLEQLPELTLMRAVGASRAQIFGLVALEALLLSLSATVLGLLLALMAGELVQNLIRGWVPLAPAAGLMALGPSALLSGAGVGLGVGLGAGILPAWRASSAAPARAMRGV